MTSLTLYGGVGEIGGNKILLETSNGNILLDYGRRMGVTGSYYSEFLQIRLNALLDLTCDSKRLIHIPPGRASNRPSVTGISELHGQRITRN